MTETERLGRWIKLRRADAGLRLYDLSAATGIASSNLSKIERGRISPTFTILNRICKALGVDIITLLEKNK